MRRHILFALSALILAPPAGVSADPFADAVVDFDPAPGATWGQGFFPDNVLGPPQGGSTVFIPQSREEELLSLGSGGSITLAFTDEVIVDGPGVDLLIFENVLVNEPTGQHFIEAATIEVSEDGVSWHQLPFDFIPPDPEDTPLAPENFIGFAGVQPTRTNSTNGVDPTDPAVAGGDGFDLSAVGVSLIRFVRITDCGPPDSGTECVDGDGDAVMDVGDIVGSASSTAGFDLDAVVGVHTEPVTVTPRRVWELYR